MLNVISHCYIKLDICAVRAVWYKFFLIFLISVIVNKSIWLTGIGINCWKLVKIYSFFQNRIYENSYVRKIYWQSQKEISWAINTSRKLLILAKSMTINLPLLNKFKNVGAPIQILSTFPVKFHIMLAKTLLKLRTTQVESGNVLLSQHQ